MSQVTFSILKSAESINKFSIALGPIPTNPDFKTSSRYSIEDAAILFRIPPAYLIELDPLRKEYNLYYQCLNSPLWR